MFLTYNVSKKHYIDSKCSGEFSVQNYFETENVSESELRKKKLQKDELQKCLEQ